MADFHKGDVGLVAFEFTDRSGSKWRPAVVISGDRYNAGTPDVLIAAITGNLQAIPYQGDRLIAEWQDAGLLAPSLAQTKLATVESTIIGRKLGILSGTDMAELERGLREALGLE